MSEYGPEVPVSRFCESLWAWAAAIKDSERGQPVAGQGGHQMAFGSERDSRLAAIPDLIDQLRLPMMKSNLLYRLIYLGEPLRTEQCPTHQGRWSGCSWSYPFCDCQKVLLSDGTVSYDPNVTGWLLEGNPAPSANCGWRSIEDQPAKGMVKVCTLVSGHAGEHVWSEWFDYRKEKP